MKHSKQAWARLLLAGCAALAVSAPLAAAEALSIKLDLSKAPDAGDYAARSEAVIEQWYPRINEILYPPGHALPYSQIKLVFEPELGIDGAAAYVANSEMHVSSVIMREMHDRFEAMVIHELVHLNQNYPPAKPEAEWLIEGIADYIRHKYYERDILPTLRMGADGRLRGYGLDAPYFLQLQSNAVDLRPRGYLKAYTVAGSFLFWLETHKDKDVVRKLNLALSEGRYAEALFEQCCGAPLDTLWAQFVADCQAGKDAP